MPNNDRVQYPEHLLQALVVLIKQLEDAGVVKCVSDEQREKVISDIAETLERTYGKGNVPKSIFTEPQNRQALYVALATAVTLENTPKEDLQNTEKMKDTFKTLLTALHRLKPENKDKKELSEEDKKDIDTFADVLAKKFVGNSKKDQAELNQPKPNTMQKESSSDFALEWAFAMMFGMTKQGQAVVLPMVQGNYSGAADIGYFDLASSGGFIHESVIGLNADPRILGVLESKFEAIGGSIVGEMNMAHTAPRPAGPGPVGPTGS